MYYISTGTHHGKHLFYAGGYTLRTISVGKAKNFPTFKEAQRKLAELQELNPNKKFEIVKYISNEKETNR